MKIAFAKIVIGLNWLICLDRILFIIRQIYLILTNENLYNKIVF